MFDHDYFDVCDFEQLPLDTDTYLVDIADAKEYEDMMLKLFEGSGEYEHVGYVSYVAARATPLNLFTISLHQSERSLSETHPSCRMWN